MTIRVCSCPGCACHLNPPCWHCADGHEIEKPRVRYSRLHMGFVWTCDACPVSFLLIHASLSDAVTEAQNHLTDHASAIAGDDCSVCLKPIRDHYAYTPCRELP